MSGPQARGAIALDSRASWLRLAIAVTLNAIGGVGMWSVVVALPAVQADFGVAPRVIVIDLEAIEAELAA